MPQKHYLLQTCFIVLKCSCEILCENEKLISTTISIDDEVNQEVSPFVKLLEDFKSAQNEKVAELKGRIIGKLEGTFKQMIKRVIIAENKADQQLKKEGQLENEKERCDLYRVLLGIGHRIDDLEEILTAGTNVKLGNRPRDARWKDILKLDTPHVQELRKKISDVGLTNDLFATSVQKICQERKEWVGHCDVSLPEVLKESNLDEVVRMMKIPKHDSYKRTIQILLSPLTLPSTIIVSEPGDQK